MFLIHTVVPTDLAAAFVPFNFPVLPNSSFTPADWSAWRVTTWTSPSAHRELRASPRNPNEFSSCDIWRVIDKLYRRGAKSLFLRIVLCGKWRLFEARNVGRQWAPSVLVDFFRDLICDTIETRIFGDLWETSYIDRFLIGFGNFTRFQLDGLNKLELIGAIGLCRLILLCFLLDILELISERIWRHL